jgi:tetratricopeptide (TPR) repeat protein
MADASTPAGIYLCTGPLKHSWVAADDAAKCCNGYVRDKRVTSDTLGNVKLEFYWRPIDTDPPSEAEESTADIVQPLSMSAIEDEEDGEAPGTGGLSHGAFFRRVAEISEDSSPTWREMTAGLLTLRLIDRWAVRNVTGRTPSLKEYVLVRRAIDDVDDDRVHEVLLKMTDAMREFATEDVGSIPKLLFAYGLLLEEAAEWPLAIDVYETLLEQAHRPDEHEGIPLVYQRLGLSHRRLGRLCQASAIYQRGLRVARMLSDTTGALRIRVSEADLALEQGDLETATDILDEVIAEADPEREADRETRSRACHERGLIAMRLGQHEAAAPLLYEAFLGYDDTRSHVRVLGDLATALSTLGARSGAQDALHLLYEMTEQPDIRLNAAIHLLRLAAEAGDTATFEDWRQAIESGPMGTRLKCQFYHRLGEGYQRLGQPSTASLAYRLLAMLARDNDFKDFAARADEGLRGDAPPLVPQLTRVSPSVEAVLTALKRSRAVVVESLATSERGLA